MPGLVGIVSRTPSDGLGSQFKAMLAAMEQGGRLQAEAYATPNGQWALGRVHLGVFQPEPQISDETTVRVLFHGHLDNESELRRDLDRQGRAPMTLGVAGLIAALYQAHGERFAERLRGSFCVAILDTFGKTLLLVTDLTGSYPVYWSQGPRRLVFASEMKAVLQDPDVQMMLDPQAVGDFFTFGFLFGEKTLASGVRLVPPGSVLLFSWDDDRCRQVRYADPASFFSRPWEGTAEDFTEELRGVFNHAVQQTFAAQRKVGLSLSGGMDTRVILSAIDGKPHQLSTYTVGVEGCADEVIADRLSRLVGTTHRFVEIDTQYLGEFVPNLRRMVTLTDGMYLTHGLTEMMVLRFLEHADFGILLRGHGGELMKAGLAWPFHTDKRVHGMERKDQLVDYLLNRVNYISSHVPTNDLFTPAWAKHVQGAARHSLERSIAEVALSPADLCSYVYLMEHHRRFTISSLELFRNYVEIRMPFVDQAFLEVLWRAPTAWRDGTDLHRAIIGANHAALLRVRNSNTGAPAGAGPLVEKICDKFNSLFKRLNRHGYRHYHDFEEWMSQRLLTAVEELLLGHESRTRDMYQETTLRRIVEESRRGSKDYAYLFQVLLILELWQRGHA